MLSTSPLIHIALFYASCNTPNKISSDYVRRRPDDGMHPRHTSYLIAILSDKTHCRSSY